MERAGRGTLFKLKCSRAQPLSYTLYGARLGYPYVAFYADYEYLGLRS